ncbi:acyltransferase [Prosthecodimorpha hirschii]|uniref:acyltransferase n=1 Tax=Prosthecodimorpha hirschii TaxID=665126 RepID=UPI0015E3C4A8|nr:acyltransferase [Prosthecomicrobium hirschii]
MTNYNADFLSEEELRALPFARIGKCVLIDRSVSLVSIENISIGDNVRIDAHTLLIASGGISIGSHVHISAFCYLAAGGFIVLEDFSNLSCNVKIHSISDDYTGRTLTNATIPETYKELTRGQVVLGRHTIIGSGSVILPGLRLGEGTAVGALSLINRSTEDWGIYAGSPARRIRERSRELLRIETEYLQAIGN